MSPRFSIRLLTLAVIPILMIGVLSCGQKSREKGPVPQEKTDRMEGMAEPEQPGEATVMVSSQRRQIAGVRTGIVAVKPLAKTLRTVGRVELDERKVADVQIKFEGFIRDLFVNTTGAYVDKGDPLFTIYSPDVVATQEEYLLALKGARELSESPFHEIRGESRSLLEAAKRRLLLWDIGERHLTDLERTGRPELAMEMHSPISGTVIGKAVLVGGMRVEPGQPLYKIADLSSVWVLADVYESEIASVRVGQEAAMTLAYYPGETFTGRVGFIYPTLDPQTRTVKVRLEFDNPHGKQSPRKTQTSDVCHGGVQDRLGPEAGRPPGGGSRFGGPADRLHRPGGGTIRAPTGQARAAGRWRLRGPGRAVRRRAGGHLRQLSDRFGKPSLRGHGGNGRDGDGETGRKGPGSGEEGPHSEKGKALAAQEGSPAGRDAADGRDGS
ncbi:MAG: efflux RND transporter periplasmic adaptor subunit [Nitrospirae bacterium]|nr:efflux RND transporter periplasmic adaptor subunit [Nitrospirota bacterium]